MGYDDKLLKLFAKVANHYQCEPVHIGPLLTESELGQYAKYRKEIDAYDGMEVTSQQQDAIDRKEVALGKIESIQRDRVKALVKAFGKISLVINKDTCLMNQLNMPNVTIIKDSKALGPHLYLSSVIPNGERTTSNPITDRSRLRFQRHKNSWIVPHPLPADSSFPREGLNQAYNYFTTGSLRIQEEPNKPKAFYLCVNDPSAVMVSIDQSNGNFYAKRLYIDYFRGKRSHRIEPMVLDDGLLFSCDSVKQVSSEDKAVHSTDDHAPYEHRGVLAATRALVELHRPKTFYNGGDAADFESVNRHAKDRPGDREGLRVRHDLNYLRRLLNAQAENKCIKRKVLIDSNHHEWLTSYVAENPSLVGELDWITVAKERFSDWEVLIRKAGADKTEYFGDVAIRHGDNESGAKQASDLFDKYLGGHLHRFHSHRRAVSVGPGCKTGPKYLNNRLTAWQNQITSLTKFKGVGSVSPKTVLHDEKRRKSTFLYQNKIYEVDFYEYPKAA